MRFRSTRRPYKKTWLLLVIAISFLSMLVSLLLFSISPFQTLNLVAKEATIGENVIGSWQYDGLNAQGSMVFYNGYESAYIPADSKKFSADGEFVYIDAHTPDTITYESALDSELFNPFSITVELIILLCLMALPLIILRLRGRVRRQKRGVSTRLVTRVRR